MSRADFPCSWLLTPCSWLLLALPAQAAVTNIRILGTTSTQAVISYTAPDSNPCTIQISQSPTYSPLVHDVDPTLFPGANSDNRVGSISSGLARVFVAGKRSADIAADNHRYSRALQAYTTHYFLITCDSGQASGTFQTTNVPIGNTYPETPPLDPANPGEYAWPYMNWAATNPSIIDPQTGILFQPATGPRHSYLPLGPSPFGNARDIGGLGEWSNPSYALSTTSGQAAVYSGSQQSWLWLQTSNYQTPYNGGAGWTEDGYSINWFDPQFLIWSTDGQADVCLTADGVTCRSVLQTISVPTTQPSTLQTVADTNSPMVYWNDALHIMSKPNMVRRNGNVNVDAFGNVTWTGGDVFNVNWIAGSRLVINNSDCAITSLATDVSLVINLASCPSLTVPATNATYWSDNFGVLVRAHTPSATLSVKAAQWVSEESSDTGWQDGDMTVLCSPALVPDNSQPTQYGFHCTLAGVFVWINPQTGQVRTLGDYTHPPGGFAYSGDFFPSGTPCSSDANPFAADGNTEYCLAFPTAGPIIMKGVYSGNNQDVGPYPWGQQASPMTWTNLTPVSQGQGFNTLMQNFDSTFDPTLFTNCIMRGMTGDYTKVVGTCFRGNSQDLTAWMWVFNPGTATIVAAWPTWKAPATRWCREHASAQVVSSPSWIAVEMAVNSTSGASSGAGSPGGGFWQSFLTSGAVSQTPAIASGAPIPGFTGLTCPSGYAGCDVVTVAGPPCDFSPAGNEPLNCPYNSAATFLQNAQVGDILEFGTGPSNLEEAVQLIGMNGNTWAILRGYWAQYNYQTTSHPATDYLQEQCGNHVVDTTVWNFQSDPHAQDVSGAYIIEDGPSLTHGFYGKTVAAGQAQWQYCPPNASANCDGIKTSTDVPGYAGQTYTSTPLSGPAFASVAGLAGANLVEYYVAPGPVVPPPGAGSDYVIEARPFEYDGGANTVTPVTGQLYNVVADYAPPQIKRLSTLAMCGMHPLLDVSGPASLIGTGASSSYTYCVANAPGECRPGSQTGSIYVNCPNYYGQNLGCMGTEDDRGICVGASSMQLQKINQISTSVHSLNGSDARTLTAGFHQFRIGPYYWNARTLPDGSWALIRTPFFNRTRAEVFVAKLPPWGAPDSVARSTFVPVALTLKPPTGLTVNNAVVQFGYVENGSPTSFYCTSRNEACLAAAGAITESNPFAFASENPAGVPCSTGCTIQIPAIPQRVVYYQVQYRNSSNQVLAESPLQVAVAP
jgi:hypothetical protein